ncbi:MAG: double-strand break repair helicase AddA [Paracoccus sp. (in: a-proteobacteria)]|uniref:double-strand break repair helicase AddA n=1 Tax=Paracoccus sp. TaxID=267 RepID=UPI0039E43B01
MVIEFDEATLAQVRAADPRRSTWLTANAGSGKTRVLTDRVARLLLAGTAPEKILCLTYTKAAATEMQNRLLARLGKWAMLPKPDLRAELARLGEAGEPDLPAARRLFARAIEAPGGLKVQTIHSFCAGVLRRFPIEAGVPHGFTELDDRSAALIRADLIEEMAREDHPVLADLLALHSGENLDGFLAGLRGFEAPPDPVLLWRTCGLRGDEDMAALLAECFADGCRVIAALIPHLAKGGSNDQKAGAKLSAGDWQRPGLAELGILEGVLLTGASAKEPFAPKYDSFPTKALRGGSCVDLIDDLAILMERVAAARPRRIALSQAMRSLSLHRFAHEFLNRYRARKAGLGHLDFDDLIDRTARLLSESSMAQWVLFRLDGGIDHILVDEAQDTSPAQWQVIERLTDEFTSGQGTREGGRSLFVVGDPKQSIYSFQGADIAVFEARRAGFAAAFQVARNPMQVLELRHSFRSSTAILGLVDQVFAGQAAQGLGDPPQHRAFRREMPGRVDLWPAIPKPERPEPGDWTDPVDQPAENSEVTQLARAIARQISRMLGQPIFDAKTGQVRRIRAGDVLILVQRRSELFAEVIAALKSANLPVAGADRLKLAGEMAVKDIRAVLSVLATPEDDLSLAACLRSPLFGISEEQLYRLAAGRKRGEYLWRRLRDSTHRAAVETLADLMGQTGFMRPYDLIQRLLIRHGGRERLLARLGPEAQDGMDELLSQALAYESGETPSLTGFLVWLSGDDVEVRRQLGGSSAQGEGLIRVMTVHGSKGLESPIVIMPDTAKRRPPREGQILRAADGTAIWRGRKGERTQSTEALAEEQTRRQLEERKRLLYVGLTRAESWLIVAAAGETDEESWHGLVEAGFGRSDLTLTRLPFPLGGEIRRLSFGDWPESAPEQIHMSAEVVAEPDWMRAPPPPMPPKRRPVAATALGGAKVMTGADVDRTDVDGDDAVSAMLFGTRLHLLMEHLPGRDPGAWPGIARDVLADAEGGLPEPEALAALLDEARAVLTAPALAEVFDLPPGAELFRELALSAPLPGLGMLYGKIDRLVVTPERILAVDYKSNRDLPGRPEDTPLGILRQMAAYRAALSQLWPGREVRAAVLWTAARSLMPLPGPLLDQIMAGLDPALSGA